MYSYKKQHRIGFVFNIKFSRIQRTIHLIRITRCKKGISLEIQTYSPFLLILFSSIVLNIHIRNLFVMLRGILKGLDAQADLVILAVKINYLSLDLLADL